MGLTFEELQELLKYIEENHSWKNMFDITKNKKQKLIKYVSFGLDTRNCDIWSVTFYGIGCDKDSIEFKTEKGYILKDKIYEWLKNWGSLI